MKKPILLFLSLAVPTLIFNTGCSSTHEGHSHSHHSHESMWGSVKQLVAVVNPTKGNQCHGTIRFTQVDNTVYIVGDISGLTPNQKHAIHIHEFGDNSKDDGMSAGGHFNPEGHPHGLPEVLQRHAGDLGNLNADASGKAHLSVEATNISMVGMKNPIIGRSVIIHAKADDGGQPTGNAGGRIGCGIIGIANPVQ